jgi:uncharacterized protein
MCLEWWMLISDFYENQDEECMPEFEKCEGQKSREFWIKRLCLTEHPEGGYYRYEFSSGVLRKTSKGRERKEYSGIYFLVTNDSPSRFHRMRSDEIWHYHIGDPLTMHVIDALGRYRQICIGPNIDHGQMLSAVMRAGWIFGASVDSGDFTLVSCTAVPGFDESDYKLFTQSELIEKFPKYKNIVERMALKDSSR